MTHLKMHQNNSIRHQQTRNSMQYFALVVHFQVWVLLVCYLHTKIKLHDFLRQYALIEVQNDASKNASK